ncbi:MAG TPA: 3-hydroxyacyl-ACP dehydratase FabZ [Rhodanobacteraceae bacterium]|nr:3-hydroxyacyl-ACP dehydratase FabZ [Rhodanobacteraceae bacterium]
MTDRPTPPAPAADVIDIMSMLPHRYPFLMVDRVLDFEPGKHLRAIKNVSVNEPCFQGHFPGNPVMPGVLIIEALAQASGLLVQLSAKAQEARRDQQLYYLVKVDKARFSRIVGPGDQLLLEVTQKRMLRRMGLFVGRALVDGEEVACAELLCAERGQGPSD